MFCELQKFTQHSINMRLSEWWLDFHFWMNLSFNDFSICLHGFLKYFPEHFKFKFQTNWLLSWVKSILLKTRGTYWFLCHLSQVNYTNASKQPRKKRNTTAARGELTIIIQQWKPWNNKLFYQICTHKMNIFLSCLNAILILTT